MTTKNPIICVDFDGVIHSYASGWKGADVIPDPPIEGALDWIRDHLPIPEAISAMGPEYVGPEVVIYSARSSQRGGIKAMKHWFVMHGLHPAYIYDDILKFPETKPAAFLTIDDRAICFTGRFPTTEEMMGFQSWQKRDVAGNPTGSIFGIVPQKQPTGGTCVQACLAMALGVPVAEVIGRFGEEPMNQQSLAVALTQCSVVWNQLTQGTMVHEGWYFAAVPSLNRRGGSHQLLVRYTRTDGRSVIDPAIGEAYAQDGSDLEAWSDLIAFWPVQPK